MQRKVVEDRIEPVHLEPRRVIDHCARSAQLLDEHLVAQALRGTKIGLALGKGHAELRSGLEHREINCLIVVSRRFRTAGDPIATRGRSEGSAVNPLLTIRG